MKKMVQVLLVSFLVLTSVAFVKPSSSYALDCLGRDRPTCAKWDYLRILQKIPKSLKKSNEVVDLKKFSQKIRGTNDYKDPKSGWIISKNKGKSHGGSAWKLYNKGKKERIASLTSSGKVLRE